MTFLQPFAVWFLAGLPLIVLLYFLRLKRRAVTVSTHLFWQRVLTESSRRAFFQRLRQLLSLLLHLLIFFLIVAALSRPLFERKVFGGTSTVLILDVRARMQATENNGQTRFAKAVAAAREYIRQAGGDREFALVTLGENASVVVPFTADDKLLRDGLEKLRPLDAHGEAEPSVRLADSLLSSRSGDRRAVFISDRAAPTGGTRSDAPALASHVVGTSLDNAAITRFAVRPVPANPATSEILLEIQNFSAKPLTTEVELTFDGRPLEVKPLTLAAGERRQEIFASVPRPTRSARGWLVAQIAHGDVLPVDNVAFATLPPSKAARVLLLSRGNPFIEKFLAVDPGIKFEVLAPEEWAPALAKKFEVVIFDGALPTGFDLTTAEQFGGNYLFLKTTPFESGAAFEQPLITEVDLAHPITQLAALQNITIAKASALAVPAREGWTFVTPLRSFEKPLLLAGQRANQRLAAIAFDVLDSDLPLRVAFPLLMSSTLHWLAGSQQDAPPTAQAGETITLGAGELIAPEPVNSPPKVAPTPTIGGSFQPMRNGFYAMSGESARWLSVNTFSAAESDLRSSGPASAPVSAWSRAPQFTALPPWQWLALAALALFTVEWRLFHRRKTE